MGVRAPSPSTPPLLQAAAKAPAPLPPPRHPLCRPGALVPQPREPGPAEQLPGARHADGVQRLPHRRQPLSLRASERGTATLGPWVPDPMGTGRSGGPARPKAIPRPRLGTETRPPTSPFQLRACNRDISERAWELTDVGGGPRGPAGQARVSRAATALADGRVPTDAGVAQGGPGPRALTRG